MLEKQKPEMRWTILENNVKWDYWVILSNINVAQVILWNKTTYLL